jgi:tetratricopeptide (TPR) repeat protein
LEEAGSHFALALKLSPENIAAEINRTYNAGLRAGKPKAIEIGKTVEDRFGSRYRTWSAVLAANGPIDEPGFCFRLGETMAQQSLLRQAAMQFIRTVQLDPAQLEARFWLANIYLLAPAPEKVLEVTAEIRAQQKARPMAATNQVELVRLEALANFHAGNTDLAVTLLLDAQKQFPTNSTLLGSLTQIYFGANRLTNALASIEQQLALNKDDLHALLNKSAILIRTKAYQEALAPLNHALELDPKNQPALMNRAIASLQSDDLDAAQRDYEALQKALPQLHAIYFGLGEIAYRRKDVPSAIKHYESYLKFAPPDTTEFKTVTERLQQLKSGSL